MKNYFLLTSFLMLLLLLNLTGCETVKGIGKDIENTGDNIYDVFNRAGK